MPLFLIAFFVFMPSFLWAKTLSPALQKAVLNQCIAYTENKSSCECAIKKLGNKYDLNTLVALENGTLSQESQIAVLSDVFSAASECFVQDECAAEIDHILGSIEAKKTCACAVERLLKMSDIDRAKVLAANENFFAENEKRFEKQVMQEIMPCLPKKVTPAIKKNLIDECSAEAGNREDARALCACVTEEIFKEYSLPKFIGETFGESAALNEYMERAVQKCKQ